MGLRDRLRSRTRPQAVVALRIDASPEAQLREERLHRLQQEVSEAEQRGEPTTVAALLPSLKDAEAEVEQDYEQVVINALPATVLEELVAQHPPTPKQLETQPPPSFNRDTFYPALLAACVQSDMSAEEWTEAMTSGDLVLGEVSTLIEVAMQLNDRSPAVTLGKDSTPTRS